MDEIEIRLAEPEELVVVAEMRWRWFGERDETPTITREQFVDHFVTWARQHMASHRCVVMVRGETVIGMAFLAIVPRVPSPRAPERASGDLQCVYVVPEERDGGNGGRLVDAVVARAHELGLERVTVHSSPRAIPMYRRHGFDAAPRLLHADVVRSSR